MKTRAGEDKHMTVKEAADMLGVSEEAIKKHIRELYPNLMRNGLITYLNEEKITEIKQKMRPTTLVAGVITDLEAAKNDERLMTVKEVGEVLGVSENTILNSYNEIIPQSQQIRIGNGHGGKPQIQLTEAQVTAVKLNLRKNSEVAQQPKTDLEMMIMVQQSMDYLREKVKTLEAENAAKEQRLAVAEPKAAFTDLAMQSQDTLSMNDAAKVLKLGYGNITLFKKLREMKILMDDNVPYQEYIGRGYFKVDEKPLLIGETIQIKRVTRVTQKGLEWLARKVAAQHAGAV